MNTKKHYPGSDFEDAEFKKHFKHYQVGEFDDAEFKMTPTLRLAIRIVSLLAMAIGLLIIGIKLSR